MRAGFKAQVERDIKSVFNNPKEHADRLRVQYNGKSHDIPVIVDHEGARDRRRLANDHGDGIFVSDLTVYISFYDLEIVPRKETEIIIDGIAYSIAEVGCDAGEITLDLELLDE